MVYLKVLLKRVKYGVKPCKWDTMGGVMFTTRHGVFKLEIETARRFYKNIYLTKSKMCPSLCQTQSSKYSFGRD